MPSINKDRNGEFKDSLIAQELRKLVKSKIFHTVKFILVGSNLLEQMVAGCMKKLDHDSSSWDKFKTSFGKVIVYSLGHQRYCVAQDTGAGQPTEVSTHEHVGKTGRTAKRAPSP